MIASLLLWIYAGALFYIYGRSAFAILDRWLKLPAGTGIEASLSVLLGLVLVTTFAATLSLFMPLGLAAALILLVLGLGLLAVGRPSLPWAFHLPKGVEWISVLIMLVVLGFCLENGTHTPANPDTNSYHAQTIRWIETYPAVPGLGNLNARLAFNSDWLVLNAAFSFAFLQFRSFHLVAGLLFIVSMLFFVRRLQVLARQPSSLSGWLSLLFIPIAFWILGVQLSSPGNDLPVILLTWILLVISLESCEAGGADPVYLGLMAVIPPYMVTLKLTAAPLLLLTVYALVRLARIRHWGLATAAGALSLAILVPWIARSVVLSGYPVFPYPQLDLFRVDWKMPADYVDAARGGIIGFARLPNKDWFDALQMPYQVWIPQWIAQQTGNQRAVLIVAALAPLVLLFRANRPYALPIGVNYVAMLVWFLGAPSLRFGYGVVLGLAVFAVASLLVLVIRGLSGRGFAPPWMALPVVMTAFLVLTLVGSVDVATLPSRLLLPLDYFPSRVVPCPLGDLSIYCAAVNKQCSYAAFPCVPSLPAGLEPRGPGLEDGFYSLK